MELIDGRFQLLEKLGYGGYGDVYTAFDYVTKSTVAIKLERTPGSQSVKVETEVYKALTGVEGIPRTIGTGKHGEKNYAAMELLGKDLKAVCAEVHLSVKDVLLIAIKLIKILQRIHARGIVHQDLKPANIMFSKHDKDSMYIMDFGLARSFVDENGFHDEMEDSEPFGTIPYASLNCHRGKTQSRRDDLEALGYVLLVLLNGDVPWLLEDDEEEETFENIYPLKSMYSARQMFEGHSSVFALYMGYCKRLGYEDEPKYSVLIRLFETELERLGFDADASFDFNKEESSITIADESD